MRLHSMQVSGFKRIKSAQISFGDATFLIGMNNAGKSSVLQAIDTLLSAKKNIDPRLYYSEVDAETGETKTICDTVIIEAEFRNVPEEAKGWKGFKGRIFQNVPDKDGETGLSIKYRKTYPFAKEAIIEIRSREMEKNAKFVHCKTGQDYIDAGIPLETVQASFPDLTKPIGESKAALEKLHQIDEIWDEKPTETWAQNPGGIQPVVLSMLPRFLLIPADASGSEIDGNSSVLTKTMIELFEDVRAASKNYTEAQKHLNELAKELDPVDENSEFGRMIIDLNKVLSSVFPDSQLHAKAVLSDPSTAIKPSFSVELSSNVRTLVSHQGSGMVRAAAFGILRFRQKWLSTREDKHPRSLIVCFEEPETFLHPSAANQMRNAIYDLSSNNSQIVATTHSPYMIDLSRKPRQVLNCIRHDVNGVAAHPFNVSESYEKLEKDDKDHVKMLARIDDHVARVFFTKHTVIVEGDTEEVVLKETLRRLPKEAYMRVLSDFEIVKARGKASIISFVKYLKAMDMHPIVVHDRDQGTPKAEVFNAPIAAAVGINGKVIQMHECVENEMGYPPATSEKPYNAYKATLEWGDNWDDIPKGWRTKMREIFGEYVPAVS
ncbi:ATP-dependent endonuclease [uncultured Massilia sp.]|uniref:ATP-dependent nuclease n=1 Tax=uncultured Massilia sp. TaxID=169973 RepID=UPI0025886E9A|nr:AAA family ATPase [uncultured Massilia sp.]